MTIEEMRRIKKERGFNYKMIAEGSGVPLGTVQKVLGGTTGAPRHGTLVALERFFRALERYDTDRASYQSRRTGDHLREEQAAYELPPASPGGKRQGEYTLEDYLAIPDERRVELIDGVIYDMTAPYATHQMIAGQIYAMLLAYITKKKGNCIPFIAPADVQLDRDDKTILQPDVFVVCDRDQILELRIFGAPDFIVEILSRSTRRKDMFIKLNKYKNAGVREYWMVDPREETVIVYCFDREDVADSIRLYSFKDKVPVGIFDGDCRIDFKLIADYIGFLKDKDGKLPD